MDVQQGTEPLLHGATDFKAPQGGFYGPRFLLIGSAHLARAPGTSRRADSERLWSVGCELTGLDADAPPNTLGRSAGERARRLNSRAALPVAADTTTSLLTSNSLHESLGETMSKVWFVTGSGRGLGRAITEAALDAGDRVRAALRAFLKNPNQPDLVATTYTWQVLFESSP